MSEERPRYRVPAVLGGGVYEGTADGGHVLLDIPGFGVVQVNADAVTRVLPEEPDGGWVTVQAGGEPRPFVFSRHDDPLGETPNAAHWWWHDKQQWVDWQTIIGLGTPCRMSAGAALTSPGRVLCPVCKQMRSMRVDGTLANHDRLGGRGTGRCPGSRTVPSERGVA